MPAAAVVAVRSAEIVRAGGAQAWAGGVSAAGHAGVDAGFHCLAGVVDERGRETLDIADRFPARGLAAADGDRRRHGECFGVLVGPVFTRHLHRPGNCPGR